MKALYISRNNRHMLVTMCCYATVCSYHGLIWVSWLAALELIGKLVVELVEVEVEVRLKFENFSLLKCAAETALQKPPFCGSREILHRTLPLSGPSKVTSHIIYLGPCLHLGSIWSSLPRPVGPQTWQLWAFLQKLPAETLQKNCRKPAETLFSPESQWARRRK